MTDDVSATRYAGSYCNREMKAHQNIHYGATRVKSDNNLVNSP